MGKDYLTDLQEWVKQKKGLNGKSANSARVVFLAIREDVKNAIEAGYSLTTIWEHMHETGRVTTTYETFRRHVRRYIDERKRASAVSERTPTGAAVKKESQQAGPSPKRENVIPEITPVKREPPTNTGSQLPTFNFNPGKKKGTN
ncbi:TraK family protein [Escherichia coli]|uniref:TraK family protein n=1 Tax=Enterobacteriaceae TaxID=543 RepID=UPI0005109C49|nr:MULTISPECIES: TraK family protein [Enterobacteriaceae]EAY5119520.1 DNA-processing protein [Salmonella enterica]EFD6870871.1 TraK family protein [Escherichia coli]EFK1442217.1 TraK family protein [Escherichia coli]EFK2453447.1 TraK family protein [Escherichia coli]EGI6778958.1 TraK family protein [Escherichia coli]